LFSGLSKLQKERNYRAAPSARKPKRISRILFVFILFSEINSETNGNLSFITQESRFSLEAIHLSLHFIKQGAQYLI